MKSIWTDSEFLLSFVLTVFIVCGATCIILCNAFSEIKEVKMVKHGYEQVTTVGYSYPVWQKATNKKDLEWK